MKIGLALGLLIAVAAGRVQAKAVHEVLWETPLKVIADYQSDDPCCEPGACGDKACVNAVKLSVEGLQALLQFSSEGMGGPASAVLKAVKERSSFKDGHAFIWAWCGCNSRGGSGYMAFRTGPKPAFLGYLIADNEPYKDGKFFSDYEPLGSLAFGARGDSPTIAAVLVDHEEGLSVDVPATWKKNKAVYDLALAHAAKAKPAKAGKADRKSAEARLAIELLAAAQLSKFVAKDTELQRCLGLAKKLLSPEHSSAMLCMLEMVEPLHPDLSNAPTQDSQVAEAFRSRFLRKVEKFQACVSKPKAP